MGVVFQHTCTRGGDWITSSKKGHRCEVEHGRQGSRSGDGSPQANGAQAITSVQRFCDRRSKEHVSRDSRFSSIADKEADTSCMGAVGTRRQKHRSKFFMASVDHFHETIRIDDSDGRRCSAGRTIRQSVHPHKRRKGSQSKRISVRHSHARWPNAESNCEISCKPKSPKLVRTERENLWCGATSSQTTTSTGVVAQFEKINSGANGRSTSSTRHPTSVFQPRVNDDVKSLSCVGTPQRFPTQRYAQSSAIPFMSKKEARWRQWCGQMVSSRINKLWTELKSKSDFGAADPSWKLHIKDITQMNEEYISSINEAELKYLSDARLYSAVNLPATGCCIPTSNLTDEQFQIILQTRVFEECDCPSPDVASFVFLVPEPKKSTKPNQTKPKTKDTTKEMTALRQ